MTSCFMVCFSDRSLEVCFPLAIIAWGIFSKPNSQSLKLIQIAWMDACSADHCIMMLT